MLWYCATCFVLKLKIFCNVGNIFVFLVKFWLELPFCVWDQCTKEEVGQTRGFFSHRPFSDSFRQPRLFHLAKPEEPFSNCARISLRRQWFPSVPLNLPRSLIIHLLLLPILHILLTITLLLVNYQSSSPPSPLLLVQVPISSLSLSSSLNLYLLLLLGLLVIAITLLSSQLRVFILVHLNTKLTNWPLSPGRVYFLVVDPN